MMGRGSRALASAYAHANPTYQEYDMSQDQEYYNYPAEEVEDYQGHQNYQGAHGLAERFRGALNLHGGRRQSRLGYEEGSSRQPLWQHHYTEQNVQMGRQHQNRHRLDHQQYPPYDPNAYVPPVAQPYYAPEAQVANDYHAGYDPDTGAYLGGYAEEYDPNYGGRYASTHIASTGSYGQQGGQYHAAQPQAYHAPAQNFYPHARQGSYAPIQQGYPAPAPQGYPVAAQQAYNEPSRHAHIDNLQAAEDYIENARSQAFHQWELENFPQGNYEEWEGPEYDVNEYPQEGEDDVFWQPYGQASYDLPDYGEEWRRQNPEEHHDPEWYVARQQERLASATIPGATYVLDEDDNDDDDLFPTEGGIVEVRHKDGSVNRVTIVPPKPGKRFGIKHDFSQENPISWWKYMSSKEDRKAAVRQVRKLTGYDKWWWKRIYAKNRVMVRMVQSDAIQLLDKHGYKSTPEQKRAIARGILKNRGRKRPILRVPEYNADRAWYEDKQQWENVPEDED